MTTAPIEYAAAGLSPAQAATAADKLRHAPPWVRSQTATAARAAASTPSAPRETLRDLDRRIGWLVGTICPGVSNPCRSSRDGRTLHEQFTPAAWRSLVKQCQDKTRAVPVTWGHTGPTICTTRDLDVVVWISPRVGELVGPEFQARLPDSQLGREVLERAADGVGVSLGYYAREQWIVDRDGVGEVRCVDDMRVDHIAILPPSADLVPCFRAARAFAAIGRWLGPPAGLADRAHVHAWPILKRQAGVPA